MAPWDKEKFHKRTILRDAKQFRRKLSSHSTGVVKKLYTDARARVKKLRK
jgi:hypothetical protein